MYETIRRFHRARPFKRFVLRLTDGRSLRVDQPEYLLLAAAERLIVVYTHKDGVEFVDAHLVTGVKASRDRSNANVEKIRELYYQEPFAPFTLKLADGRSVRVRQRDYFSISHSGRTVVVHLPDDTMEIVNLTMVTGLTTKSNGAGHRKRK